MVSSRHPATNRTGTWNAVVVATGTGGVFAIAVADEQSGIARTATDAAAQTTKGRRIAARRTALASRVGSIPTLLQCQATRLVAPRTRQRRAGQAPGYLPPSSRPSIKAVAVPSATVTMPSS